MTSQRLPTDSLTPGPASSSDQPRPASWALPLLAVLLIGGFLRVYGVGHSLWADELHTAWCVADGFEQISHRSWLGNQAPLYFWIVWAFQLVLGNAEWALRLPSLLAGLAIIPLAFVVGRSITRSSGAGLLAALLAALSPTLVYFSQEARVYAIVQCLALLQVGLFHHTMQRPAWFGRMAGVAASVALFYLHYTTALLFVAEGVWYAWRLAASREDRPPRYRWPWFVCDALLIAGCCTPAVWHLLAIAAKRHEWSQFVPSQSWRTIGQIFIIFPLAFYVGLPLVITAGLWGASRLLKAAQGQTKPRLCKPAEGNGSASLLVCWYFVPVGLAWVSTLAGWAPIFFPRYVMVCALAPLLASAWLWSRLSGWLAGVFCLAAVVAPQFQLVGPIQPGFVINFLAHGDSAGHFQEDWRGAIESIRSQRLDESKNFPVFVQPALIESDGLLTHPDDLELREYLLFPVRGPYRFADDRQVFPLPNSQAGRLSPSHIELIKQAGGAWFVLRGANPRQIVGAGSAVFGKRGDSKPDYLSPAAARLARGAA